VASNRQIEANCGNAKRSTGPKAEVGKIGQVETLCVMDCQSQRRAQNIVRFDPLAKESDLVGAKLELSRIHAARSALLAAPGIPSWRNACADSIAMNAKFSRSRDGCCAVARYLFRAPGCANRHRTFSRRRLVPRRRPCSSPKRTCMQPYRFLDLGEHPEDHSHIRTQRISNDGSASSNWVRRRYLTDFWLPRLHPFCLHVNHYVFAIAGHDSRTRN
jgi:hypothetical protein